MKSIYTIGRDASCDIILQDPLNMVSRVHATLRVGKRGKYTISDQSMNGTYVNGIRIAQGVEFPVSRKDVISFAHQLDFDWSLIPNVALRRKIVVFSIIAGLLLAGALGYGVHRWYSSKTEMPAEEIYMPSETNVADTSGRRIRDASSQEKPMTPVEKAVPGNRKEGKKGEKKEDISDKFPQVPIKKPTENTQQKEGVRNQDKDKKEEIKKEPKDDPKADPKENPVEEETHLDELIII